MCVMALLQQLDSVTVRRTLMALSIVSEERVWRPEVRTLNQIAKTKTFFVRFGR